MQLFYAHRENGQWELTEEEARHLKVLRKNPGDTLLLTDGNGYLAQALLRGSPKRPELDVLHIEEFDPYQEQLEIAVAPLKNHDRMDWMVEKCTEIGISAFHFIQCDHSERHRVRIDRLEKKAISAMKQSGRVFLPRFSMGTLNEFVDKMESYDEMYVAHCQKDDHKLLPHELHTKKGRHLLFIGPEGDFSSSEIQMLRAQGARSLSLGPFRLRTETAVVAICSYVQMKNAHEKEYAIED